MSSIFFWMFDEITKSRRGPFVSFKKYVIKDDYSDWFCFQDIYYVAVLCFSQWFFVLIDVFLNGSHILKKNKGQKWIMLGKSCVIQYIYNSTYLNYLKPLRLFFWWTFSCFDKIVMENPKLVFLYLSNIFLN